MNRAEYISQLEFSLKGKLPPREINEILRDYSEYFEAGKSEGKTEEEISVNLGIPSMVAEQILSENEEEALQERHGLRYYWNRLIEKIKSFLEKPMEPDGYAAPQPAPEGEEPPKKVEKASAQRASDISIIKTLLIILLCLLALPVCALLIPAGLALIAGLVAAVLGIGVALVMVFGALVFGAVAAAFMLASLAVGTVSLPGSFVALGVFGILLCLAGAVLSVCLIIYLIRWIVRLVRSCFGRQRNPNSARNPAYQARNSAARKEGGGYGGLPYGEEPSVQGDEEDYEEEEQADA